MDARCPFTEGPCDGGTVHADGRVGCGFKESPDAECEWLADVPDWEHPRDFRNRMLIDAAMEATS